jgi:hypothetical protein
MLKHARRPVLAELALSLSLSDGDAECLLDSAVLGRQHTAVPVRGMCHNLTPVAERSEG